MKRPTASKPAKGKWTCSDKSFATEYPCLVEMMCDSFWEDGKPRECSSLSVRMDATSTFVSLSDHALQCSAYTTAGTLQEALHLMEAALAEGKLVFRPWKAGKGR